MRDIQTRRDIEELVVDFYEKALNDKMIGYIFKDVAKINLDTHLTVIADFWEMILFRNVNFQKKYSRSPMQTHVALHDREKLKLEHFARWLNLFSETLDAKFAGETANLAKVRALSIANTMSLKFSGENDAGARAGRG